MRSGNTIQHFRALKERFFDIATRIEIYKNLQIVALNEQIGALNEQIGALNEQIGAFNSFRIPK